MLCAKVHKTIWPVNDVIWKTIRCAHKALNMNTLLELDVREKRTYDNMLRNTSNTSYLIDWYAYWNWNKWQTIKKGNTMFCTLVSTSWMYNVRRKHDMVHREPKREEKKNRKHFCFDFGSFNWKNVTHFNSSISLILLFTSSCHPTILWAKNAYFCLAFNEKRPTLCCKMTYITEILYQT